MYNYRKSRKKIGVKSISTPTGKCKTYEIDIFELQTKESINERQYLLSYFRVLVKVSQVF